jgi:hypothetical protein
LGLTRTRRRGGRTKTPGQIFRAVILGSLSLMLIGPAAGADVAFAAPVRLGSAPLVPAGARAAGTLAGNTSLHLTVALAPRDPSALAAFAQEVSTPGSAAFRQYLSVAEFRRRFAPTEAQIAAVRTFLSGRGLTPGPVTANGLAMSISTTATRAEGAFSVELGRYVLRGGRVAYANTAAPSLDSSVARLVQSLIGLNTLAAPRPLSVPRLATPHAAPVAPRVVTGGPQPCAEASAVNIRRPTTYTADQIAAAYRFSSLYAAGNLGAGQTIALYELESFSSSDIAAYQACYGTATSVSQVPVDGGPSGSVSGGGEAALDVENLIGLVPRANILVYSGPNAAVDTPGSGPYDTYAAIINENRAKVISTSWGLCEPQQGATNAAAENTLFQEAAAQGQSIVAASGDSGAQDCTDQNGRPLGGLAVDDPASQPFVTGVGGTTLSAVGPPPSETVWNDAAKPAGPAGSGGGGVSSLWPMPAYQSSVPLALNVINAGSSGAPCRAAAGFCREVPDVSANADPYTGYAIYFAGSWLAIGGTSAAAPTWAALLALSNASPVCGGVPVGFANNVLYRTAGTLYATTFNDIVVGNNAYAGAQGFSAASGYDMASGLGTPDGATLSAAICDRVTVTNPGNQASVQGALSSLRIAAVSAAGASDTFTAAGLPPGLSLNPTTGVISGAATRTGVFKVTVGVRDADGAVGAVSFNWTVAAPSVRFAQPKTQFGAVGKRTSLALGATVTNGRAPSYAVRGLPPGLSLNSRTGLISGIPSRVGRYEVSATASDTTGASARAHFSWRIGQPPSVQTSSLSGVTSGKLTLISALTAGRGAGAVAVVSVSLPLGLSYHSTRGQVRGVALSGSGGGHVSFSEGLSHGALILALRRPVRFLRLTLTPPGLQASAGLTRQAASGRISNRRIRITVTDSNQLSTTMLVSLRIG